MFDVWLNQWIINIEGILFFCSNPLKFIRYFAIVSFFLIQLKIIENNLHKECILPHVEGIQFKHEPRSILTYEFHVNVKSMFLHWITSIRWITAGALIKYMNAKLIVRFLLSKYFTWISIPFMLSLIFLNIFLQTFT